LTVTGGSVTWNNNLATDGSISVASLTVAKPVITSIILSGANLVFSGTNGTGSAGGTYYVLSSTNVAAPLSSWTRIFTNTFITGGASRLRTPSCRVCPTGSIFWTCLNQQICKTKPPVEKTLHWRFFFDAFCTIRNASFLETFRCQTHPASIGFIDMPLDFKSSMPVRELVCVMTSAAPMRKITRLSGVTVDVLVKKVRCGQTSASRNGCGLTAYQPNRL